MSHQYPDLARVRNSERQTPLFYASDSVRKAIKGEFSVIVGDCISSIHPPPTTTSDSQRAREWTGFLYALNNRSFSDLSISIDGRTFHCHRALIDVRCPTLAQRIGDRREFSLVDSSASAFLTFLRYLYTDMLSNYQDAELRHVVSLAERFELLRLKKLCIDATANFAVDIPQSTFAADLLRLLEARPPKYSDITLAVDNHDLALHKVVLCRQDYFAAMFSGTHRLKEAVQSKVEIGDVSIEAFRALVYYCYTWKLEEELDIETLAEIFEVSLRNGTSTIANRFIHFA
jgi:hypothetical protein